MRRMFEYLVAFVERDRVVRANGHWQGDQSPDAEDATSSCPSLFDWLEAAGAQGWELVAVDPEGEGTSQLYLKRTREQA